MIEGSRCYSVDHAQLCLVIETQTLWGETSYVGFKKAWQERDYAAIITVARKIPENVLQEDPKLLMWYDQALTRMGK